MASTTFLALNGIRITASAHDVETAWTELATVQIDETELTHWFESHVRSST